MIEKLKSLRPKGEEKPNLEKLRAAANELIDQYKALSEEAKENLKTTFPKTHAIVESRPFVNFCLRINSRLRIRLNGKSIFFCRREVPKARQRSPQERR